MNFDLIISNILNPPVLFYFLGLIATQIGSDLEVPQPLPKLFSLYLLLSIGFKGGLEISKSGFHQQALITLLAASLMAVIIPLYSYVILRRKLNSANSAAIAATYGSVSAVTFIAATSFLSKLSVTFNGYMVAAMALMESPAIVVGVALSRMSRKKSEEQDSWKHIFQEAFLNGSIVLLAGSLVIGLLTGEEGEKAIKPFTGDIFKGVLCLFLLDMGLVSGRRFSDLKSLGIFPVAFAILMPLFNASLAIFIAHLLGLSFGDALLFSVLCASASYIAVPAAVRLAIPEANPSFYVTMALAVTFPFNILIGLPIYLTVIKKFWG